MEPTIDKIILLVLKYPKDQPSMDQPQHNDD
jgi:hypothetical protein